MGRVPDVRRIQKEDFDSKDHEMIEKLAFPLNSFMEQTRAVLQKSVDFNNLNQEIIELVVIVDMNGLPTTDTKYLSNLKTKVTGIVCVNAQNMTDITMYPTGQPFISFAQNNTIVNILHVTGLQADHKYQLRLVSIGA